MMRTLLLYSLVLFAVTYAALVDKTIIEWSRQIRTCDVDGDRDIAMTGTTPVVYAMNERQTPANLRTDDSPTYHTTRGSSEIFFGDPNAGAHRKNQPGTTVVSFRTRPVTLPAKPTYYHCQGFRYNWGENKRHAIQITPNIDFANRDLVHHIVFQICTIPLTPVDLLFSGDCYTPPMPPGLLVCDQKAMFAAWAVGGGPIVLPPQAGIPVQGTSYYMMQIHYNNPNMLSGVRDSVGMNITVTPHLRPNDAACLELLRSYASILIPPLMPEFVVEGYGDYLGLAQTLGGFPRTAYIFATLLHMHQLGRKMRVSHWRNGNYIGDIDSNPNYDFEFQQTVGLSPHYRFNAGDSIKWECTYNSTSRTLPTTGGTTTGNEMCQAYVYYYPATRDPLTVIESFPATIITGNSPAFVAVGLLQSGIPVTGGPVLSRATPPPPQPRACATTNSRPYTTGTAGTTYLPISRFNASKYRNYKVLDSVGKYVLHWNLLANKATGNGIIQFAAEVETKGWLGFGISPNGNMVGSDIVLGWVDEVAGTVNLLDRKANAKAQPSIDPTQDIFNIRGYKGRREQTPPEFNPIFRNINAPPRRAQAAVQGGGGRPQGPGGELGGIVETVTGTAIGLLGTVVRAGGTVVGVGGIVGREVGGVANQVIDSVGLGGVRNQISETVDGALGQVDGNQPRNEGGIIVVTGEGGGSPIGGVVGDIVGGVGAVGGGGLGAVNQVIGGAVDAVGGQGILGAVRNNLGGPIRQLGGLAQGFRVAAEGDETNNGEGDFFQEETGAEAFSDEFSVQEEVAAFSDEFFDQDAAAGSDPTQLQPTSSSSTSSSTPSWAVVLIVLGSVIGVLAVAIQVQIIVMTRNKRREELV